MGYEQELTFQLRTRGRSEDEIAETLRELRAHDTHASTLHDEFGSPEEYARSFERTKRRTLGARVTIVASVTAVAWVAVWIIIGLIRKHAFGIEPALEGVIESWGVSAGALVIVAAGLLAGFLTDRLRPARKIS